MTENSKYLSKELVSLVHNIELSKSGWWDVALQRLIIGALWLSSDNLSCLQIADFLNTELYISVNIHRIQNQVNALCDQKTLILLTDNKFKLTERTKLDFEDEIAKAEAISEYAQSEFEKIITRECPEFDPKQVWLDLNALLLIPAIKQMGVRFYEFVTGEKSSFDEFAVFDGFLTHYPVPSQNALRLAVTQYLSKKDGRIRSFILRQLYTSLVIEANNLDEDTIKKFSQTNKKKLAFKIFVDTNFIFSMFGVHDNPFNADAKSLVALIQNISDSISTKLYVSTITIEETRQAIQNSIDYYNHLRLSPNLANASLQSMNLGGFLRKLAIEVAKSGQTLTAQDFYGPYKTDLVGILRANGIELYNTDLSKYKSRQDVVDNILAQIEFEEKRYGKQAKSYKKAQHDIILWHFVNDNRPTSIESPSDAEYWIVTVDFRFLGFDSYKNRFSGSTLPICLLPSQLIQLLQFWVPRTSQFEKALFESWLWPLLFQEIDNETEQVTVKILNALSRYEKIDDLPEEAISQILLNSALRQRIALEPDVSEQIEMVKLALIESHTRISNELVTTRKKVGEYQIEISKFQRELESKEKAIQNKQNASRKKDILIQNLSQEIQQALSENETLNARIDNIQNVFQAKERKEKIGRIRKSFITQIVGCFLLVLILSAIFTKLTQKLLPLPLLQIFIGFFTLALIGWIEAVDRKGLQTENVADWTLFAQYHKLKKWLFGVLGFVILAILKSAIGDYLWNPIRELISK